MRPFSKGYDRLKPQHECVVNIVGQARIDDVLCGRCDSPKRCRLNDVSDFDDSFIRLVGHDCRPLKSLDGQRYDRISDFRIGHPAISPIRVAAFDESGINQPSRGEEGEDVNLFVAGKRYLSKRTKSLCFRATFFGQSLLTRKVEVENTWSLWCGQIKEFS